MINFDFYTPTQVVFGQDTETKVGELVKQTGAKKVLLHFGGSSAEKSGLLGKVRKLLTQAKVEFVELGGVQPNPRLSLVQEGIALCRAQAVDFILAVGGGSVIDSGKAIGYGVKGGVADVWDFYAGTAQAQGTIPLGCVLTIAAAGSEMSSSSVITNDQTGEKRGYAHFEYGRPVFAILNPDLTKTLPAYQTASGCVDILMHTLERYFTSENPTMQLTDNISEALMRTVLQNARILARSPQDYEARAQIMWAASLSHNGLTGCGNGGGDWSCHQLGHELSGKYDLAHGASLSAVWGSWARYVCKVDPERFAQLAVNVLELPYEGDDKKMALAGIEEMEEFFWAIEMPTSLTEAEIDADDAALREMAQGASRGGTRTVGDVMKLTEEDIYQIYKLARDGSQ